jgi:hypothetical protein
MLQEASRWQALAKRKVGIGILLGGRWESAAALVTEQRQPVHEQRVADEIDLLAKAADAMGSAEETVCLRGSG